MGTELDALRDEIASARAEIADLRAEVALLRGAQMVVWQQYQPLPGAAGVMPPQVIYPGTAAPINICAQPFLNTACAAPVPQVQTFAVGG